MLRPLFATLAFFLAASLASAARASGPDAAHDLFDRGVAWMQAGRFDEACPALEESHKLDSRPGTLFALADCEAKRGRLATAVQRYDQYLAYYATLPPDKQRVHADRVKLARNARAALAPDVPEVTVTLSPAAPPHTLVTRDGAALSEASLGTPLALDPGEHVFTTQAPGGPVSEKRVTVGKAEKRVMVLEVAEPSPPPLAARSAAVPPPSVSPEGTEPRRGPSTRRMAAYVTGGAGIVGLALGVVAGAVALAKSGVVDANCGVGGNPTACTPTGKMAADELKASGVASTIGFVVGGAAAVAGVVLFVTEPKPKPVAPAGSPARVASTTGGPWARLGVLAAGPHGVAAGIRGEW
jgi:hypothetical protein